MKGISVIICCYNSAMKLIPTLNHLAKQRALQGLPYEVIIVDNNCTDNTVTVAIQTWESLNAPFKLSIIKQAEPGLSHARQMGIEKASYEYAVLCDDDNWLCEDYLLKVYNLFEDMPEVAVIGGVGEATADKPIPSWFVKLQGFGYAVGNEGRQTGYVDSVYGAGMGLRKQVISTLLNEEFSFILSDRTGTNLLSGGDTEISILIKKSGYNIYFDSSLTFKHYLTSNRLQWNYYLRLRRSFGKASAYLQLYNLTDLSEQSLKNTNRVIQILSFIKFGFLHWKYMLFSNYLKNVKCADFAQQLSMRLTMINDKKKMQLITNHLTETSFKKRTIAVRR
jgi:glycosyltransferase involved in cell wall biosynthesis